MAPSAESKDGGICLEDVISEDQEIHVQYGNSTPKRNVAFAVNYELSMVDQFMASERKRRGSSVSHVNSVRASTVDPSTSSSPRTVPSDKPDVNPINPAQAPLVQTPTPLEEANNKRRSAREKKKGMIMSRTRVRYDMQLVPVVRRNRNFLDAYPMWWTRRNHGNAAAPSETTAPASQAPRRSSRLTTTTNDPKQPDPTPSSSPAEPTPTPALPTRSFSSGDVAESWESKQSFLTTETPFADNETVLWIPANRSEWEDSVSEMTAVCTSAAIRRFLQQEEGGTDGSSNKSSQGRVFYPPLSRDYVRDRVDIDDPLHGYQLRHRTGGWLQGFILWTTFTTWTHDFEWNSRHPASGMVEPASSSSDDDKSKVDGDGSLAAELQAQPRSGNPHENGIVFDNMAEISLVGGLGCGEYLLRMALDSIVASPQQYKYVVLQATDQSKAFYERFGFVRVGAMCRYGRSPLPGQPSQSIPAEAEPLEGYRHWTHANESEKSLQKHGGPSYMMCLKLPAETAGSSSYPTRAPSFLDHMRTLSVNQKPTIEQLGGSFTPGPKALRRQSSSAGDAVSAYVGSVSKKKPGRKGSGVVRASTKRLHLSPSAPLKPVDSKMIDVPAPLVEPPALKRRRIEPIPDLVDSREPSNVPRATNDSLVDPAASIGARNTKAKNPSLRRKKVLSFDEKAVQLDDLKSRPFHTVRGADGRFVTFPYPPPAPSSITSLPESLTAQTPSRMIPELSTSGLTKPLPNSGAFNKLELVKQKVKSYPRSRVHYYNRVVKIKTGKAVLHPTYYFVLFYNEAESTLCLVPMAPRGKLTGKHEGRPRYQAVVEALPTNLLRNVAATNYQVVPATMIMKTPVVANEAWDVQDE